MAASITEQFMSHDQGRIDRSEHIGKPAAHLQGEHR